MAIEVTRYAEGMMRVDPLAGLLQRRKLLDHPVRFAITFQVIVAIIYFPAALAASLADRTLEMPIWKDYPAPAFQIAWMTLAWAYAGQAPLVAESLAAGADLMGGATAVQRWSRVVASRWLPLGIGTVIGLCVLAAFVQVFPEPAFYRTFYWREPGFYYPIFVPLMALLFYFGAMVSLRQAVAGFILGRELLQFQPPPVLSHEAALLLVQRIVRLGSSLTRQAAPWVILGAWLAFWLVLAFTQDTANNSILMFTALLYGPGLICSLLLPLGALMLALMRIKRGQIRRLEEQIESEYGRALELLPDLDRMGPHNVKIRDLQQLVLLTRSYFPIMPVGGVRLRVVAGSAALQVAVFWLGLALDLGSLANLAGI